jgi:hypothetical protein
MLVCAPGTAAVVVLAASASAVRSAGAAAPAAGTAGVAGWSSIGCSARGCSCCCSCACAAAARAKSVSPNTSIARGVDRMVVDCSRSGVQHQVNGKLKQPLRISSIVAYSVNAQDCVLNNPFTGACNRTAYEQQLHRSVAKWSMISLVAAVIGCAAPNCCSYQVSPC